MKVNKLKDFIDRIRLQIVLKKLERRMEHGN